MDFLDEIKYLDKLINQTPVSDLYSVSTSLLSEKKAIIIILIRLEQLKRIELTDEGIKVIDNNYNGLAPSERFILSRIKYGRVCIEVHESTLKIICKQAINNKLMKKPVYDLQNLFGIVFYSIVLVFMLTTGLDSSTTFAWFLLFSAIALCICVALNVYLDERVAKDKAFINSKKGNELKNRLNTFKNTFLENEKDLVLWDNYELFKEIYSNDITEKGYKYKDFIVNKNKLLGE